MDFPKIRKVLIVTLLLNWLVAIAKILIGLWSGAISILTDGLHSFFDGASNILGLLGVKIAEKPKDSSHPYGHRKFEAMAAMGIAFLILITGYELLKSTLKRFFEPAFPEINFLIFFVLGGALIVDIIVYFYESRQGKKLQSNILIADSIHTKTHLFTTPAVILGAMAVKLGFPIFDPLIASVLIIIFSKLAWEIIGQTSFVLCDRALVEEEKIKKIVQAVSGINSSHQIRTRGDEHHIFLDMHITLNPDISLEEAHNTSHRLKEKITQEIPQIKDVVIHIEPTAQK